MKFIFKSFLTRQRLASLQFGEAFKWKGLVPFLLLSIVGCQGFMNEKVEAPIFRLVPAATSGIDFINQLKESPDFNILEYPYFYNGGGVAAGDINNDGLIDLYFTSNQGENKLYLNKGGLIFEDITSQAKVAGSGTWATGVTMADVNADGFLDIYVSRVGNYKNAQGKNELFINNGDNTFTESAQAYGLDFEGFSTQTAFFDYDRDGDLDMYLLNHSIKNPEAFAFSRARFIPSEKGDKLYQSQLAQGKETFMDVTEEAGIYSSALGFGLGLGIGDLNNDGWPDIYISNDFTENDYLYLNNQNGTFTEQLESSIQHTSRYSMGNVLGDLNNDGFNEIITTDMLPSDPQIWKKSLGEDKSEVYKIKLNYGYNHQYVRNTLQKNLGNGQFSDLSLLANTFATDWSWSPLIFDMDNDGFQDIHITNGIFKRPNDLDFINYSSLTSDPDADVKEADLINTLPTLKIANYAGKGAGDFRFEPKAIGWGLDQASYSNGSAYADLDNDGDLDLIVNNIEQEAFVYENLSKSENSYLTVRLKSEGFNKNAVGAKVTVTAGGREFTRENNPTKGFESSVPTDLYFGLGIAQQIDKIEITWPEGQSQTLENIQPNQVLTISPSDLVTVNELLAEDKPTLLSLLDTNIGYTHQEDDFSDLGREYIIPRLFNHEGPALAAGDVDGNGLDDIFFGGAKGQSGELWLQKTEGNFEKGESRFFDLLSIAEDVSATFFDADGDQDLDLYVTSAGNENSETMIFSYDKLYINQGNGLFQFSPQALNKVGSQGKTVSVADIDGDGDLDVFVGANVVSGAFGTYPEQFLLINNGKGFFQNQFDRRFELEESIGMVNDSEWFDYDQDGDQDLVLVGEWMPITIFENDGKGRFKKAAIKAFENTNGWWYSLHVADLNNDGKPDLVAGNLGLNTKLKASIQEPVSLYAGDFDNNGQVDPVVFHYLEGVESPFATRDDLIKQIPSIKKKHKNYTSYADLKGPADLLGEDYDKKGAVKRAFTMSSKAFINLGKGKFEAIDLPLEAQHSPTMDIVAEDFNGDNITDLLLFGNNYTFRNDYGRADAKPITLLLGKGEGHFMPTNDAFLNTQNTWGEYRQARPINLGITKGIVAVRNNDKPIILQWPSQTAKAAN